MQVVSSAIVDKYIGESARLIREMFAYARDHEPCIIFMDEIDAIGVAVFVLCISKSMNILNIKFNFLMYLYKFCTSIIQEREVLLYMAKE